MHIGFSVDAQIAILPYRWKGRLIKPKPMEAQTDTDSSQTLGWRTVLNGKQAADYWEPQVFREYRQITVS